jgi:hypothetical protein
MVELYLWFPSLRAWHVKGQCLCGNDALIAVILFLEGRRNYESNEGDA